MKAKIVKGSNVPATTFVMLNIGDWFLAESGDLCVKVAPQDVNNMIWFDGEGMPINGCMLAEDRVTPVQVTISY